MILLLQREEIDICSIGTLSIDGARECHSLELPWKENRTGVSCIPAGVYSLDWVLSPRLKRHTLRLPEVPGRSGILIHPANEVAELLGCIALGTRSATQPERLVESRRAVKRVEAKALEAWARGDTVVIDVRNP